MKYYQTFTIETNNKVINAYYENVKNKHHRTSSDLGSEFYNIKICIYDYHVDFEVELNHFEFREKHMGIHFDAVVICEKNNDGEESKSYVP